MRFKPVDPEKFSKIAAGAQSWVTAVAILVGGGWVLYTFWALGSTNKSRAEIAELEQRAVEQPVLTTQIKATVLDGVADVKRLISVEVAVRNEGKRAVEFQDAYVQIAKLATGSAEMTIEGRHQLLKAALITKAGQMEAMGPRILRSGQGRTLAFLLSAPPGSYLVQFRANYGGKKLVDGAFVDSPDVGLLALEQAMVEVPEVATRSPNTTLQQPPPARRR